MAAHKGQIEKIKIMIRKGAKLDEITADGSTALIIAAQRGHSEMIELLLTKK